MALLNYGTSQCGTPQILSGYGDPEYFKEIFEKNYGTKEVNKDNIDMIRNFPKTSFREKIGKYFIVWKGNFL